MEGTGEREEGRARKKRMETTDICAPSLNFLDPSLACIHLSTFRMAANNNCIHQSVLFLVNLRFLRRLDMLVEIHNSPSCSSPAGKPFLFISGWRHYSRVRYMPYHDISSHPVSRKQTVRCYNYIHMFLNQRRSVKSFLCNNKSCFPCCIAQQNVSCWSTMLQVQKLLCYK